MLPESLTLIYWPMALARIMSPDWGTCCMAALCSGPIKLLHTDTEGSESGIERGVERSGALVG